MRRANEKGIRKVVETLKVEAGKSKNVEAQRKKVIVARYDEGGKKKGKPVRKKEEERSKEDRR